MSHCECCGLSVPDGQHICSMCYGDPAYGNDGYYAAWMQEQAMLAEQKRIQENMAQGEAE